MSLVKGQLFTGGSQRGGSRALVSHVTLVSHVKLVSHGTSQTVEKSENGSLPLGGCANYFCKQTNKQTIRQWEGVQIIINHNNHNNNDHNDHNDKSH